MPKGAAIGTSSLRRAAQILNLYPYLKIENLRGNVDTRLKKLDAGNFDAIILAAAGLERLGYGDRIKQILNEIIPAAGQGALAVEIRTDDFEVAEIIKFLNDEKTFNATKIERDFLQVIGGSCQIPVGIFAEVDDEKISARAVIAALDGKNIVKDFSVTSIENISTFGKNFAEKILDNGGREILSQI
jgi:hydroxymethylbilane synthase